MNYIGRMYDPFLGRFIQADPFLDGLNRYAYVRNNPVKYVDPTGYYSGYYLDYNGEYNGVLEEAEEKDSSSSSSSSNSSNSGGGQLSEDEVPEDWEYVNTHMRDGGLKIRKQF
jgi:uncharacterized protein RhaS with RHS repeats